jgi:hypothetical protein
VIAITVLATGNEPPKPSTAPSLAALAVKIAIGVGLLVIALRQYRRRGHPKKPKKTPKWQVGIDRMSPWYAIGLAVLVQPWPLVAAAAATVVQAKVTGGKTYIALFVFALIATSSILALEIHAVLRPEQSRAVLARLRTWMETHRDQVIIVVSLLLGLWLIGKSSYLVAT